MEEADKGMEQEWDNTVRTRWRTRSVLEVGLARHQNEH